MAVKMPPRLPRSEGSWLDQQDWSSFDQHGFLSVGRWLDETALSALQRRMDDIMLGRIAYDDMMMQLDGGGAYDELPEQTTGFKGPTVMYRKIEGLEKDPIFFEYMRHPLMRECCARIYGAMADISVYRAMFMNKPAAKGTTLPWHQDGGEGWGLDRDPLLTVWLALDPSRASNGCVEVIDGSHRLGLLSKFGHTLSAEHVREHCHAAKVVELEADPGEVFLLHNFLIHRSGINPTGQPRRAFSVCYMDARTRRRDGKSFPFIFSLNPAVANAS
jgi:hypothetical protein